MSNIGKWNERYKDLIIPVAYGDPITYIEAAKFLTDCIEVEDWGCGSGGFLSYRPDAIGVDGSDTKFATKKFVDLRNYISDCESIHMRHVLEHDHEWIKILRNALISFRRKIVITMFVIPENGKTIPLSMGGGNTGVNDDIPTLRISRNEFMDEINNTKNIKTIESKVMKTGSCYGSEEIFFITKN
jgi:hypothetical protein